MPDVSLDAQAFRAITNRSPILHLNMLRILGADIMELQQRFREVATEKVGLRVARQLTRLHEKIGQSLNGAVEIGLSREELAQMTGTTLYTVSRLLSAWEVQGLVRSRREVVEIQDLKALAELSAEDFSSYGSEPHAPEPRITRPPTKPTNSALGGVAGII